MHLMSSSVEILNSNHKLLWQHCQRNKYVVKLWATCCLIAMLLRQCLHSIIEDCCLSYNCLGGFFKCEVVTSAIVGHQDQTRDEAVRSMCCNLWVPEKRGQISPDIQGVTCHPNQCIATLSIGKKKNLQSVHLSIFLYTNPFHCHTLATWSTAMEHSGSVCTTNLLCCDASPGDATAKTQPHGPKALQRGIGVA